MPTTVERLNEPTPAQLNQGQQKADTIPYRVAGLEFNALKALVLGGVGVPDLPSIGTPHPDFPALLCRSLRVTPIPNGPGTICRVFADFATSNFPGAGLLHAAVDVSGGQFVLSATFQDVEIELPTCKLNKYTASVGGQEASLTGWAVQMQPVTETRLVLKARWGIQGRLLTVADLNIFGEETNKIHTIGGKRYLFRAGGVTARDNLTYEVNASWELDEGTPAVKSGDTTGYLLPGDLFFRDPAPAPGLSRDPYHKVFSTPALLPDGDPDDVASWPLLAQVPYAVEGDHTRLPGVPQL